MDNILFELSSDSVISSLKQGKRLDGRGMDDYRKIKVETGISENANGSARVELGDTVVVAGIKFEVGTPFPDTPNEGSLSVGAELLPIASPQFETGPPSAEEVELARVVDRGIRHAHCVDYTKLCIEPGEKSLTLYIDMYAINYAGNLFDSCSIAALAALSTTKLPKIEDGAIVSKEYAGKLELSSKPLLSTFTKIDQFTVLDANLAEEHALNARLSVAHMDDHTVTAFQKGGPGSFSMQEMDRMIEVALKKGKEVRKHV
jgi:exosome complex component RRP42